MPLDRAVSLVWEGNWCGRVNGEKDWIIVAWNGTDFIVLENHCSQISKELKKYKGLTDIQAIALAEANEAASRERREAFLAALPKCSVCKKPFIRMYDDEDETCHECLKRQTKNELSS